MVDEAKEKARAKQLEDEKKRVRELQDQGGEFQKKSAKQQSDLGKK